MFVFTAENWSLSLANKELIKPLSWNLKQGEVLGVIGESGSGKTLLTKALLGVMPDHAKTTGKLKYQDLDLENLTGAQWQSLRGSKISYMAQNPMAVFNNFQTILSHGAEFMQSHGIKNMAEIKSLLIATMTASNLDKPEELLQRYPFELSGGMLQRVMLSMLLTMDMEVLICDEPTSALDSFNTKIIIDCLKEIKDKGISMIIVTHDYSLLEALADKIMILQKGECIEYGPAGDILTKPESAYGKKLLQKNSFIRYTQDKNLSQGAMEL